MTLVKHPVENFDQVPKTDPVTKFAEKEKLGRENYQLKIIGTIVFIGMLVCGILFGSC